jgi:hypothetical protein
VAREGNKNLAGSLLSVEYRVDGTVDAWDYYGLPYLCQAGVGRLGFTFSQEVLKQGAWKRFLREHTQILQRLPFTLKRDSTLFLPVHVPAEKLATALREEAIVDALEPIRSALETLKAAKDKLDMLLGAAERRAT